MINMKQIIKNYLPIVTLTLLMTACTLDPTLDGPVAEAPNQAGGAPTPPSLSTLYEQLNGLTGGQGNWFGLQEHSTDEIMGPTRGTD